MKREIKFEYGFGSINGIVKKKYYLSEIPFMHDKCDVWQILPVVYVRQFAGLKDKNGVDIYEGDILNINRGIFKGKINTVLFDNDEGRYLIDFEGLSKSKRISLSISKSTYIEVIGNIYENPKLLKP